MTTLASVRPRRSRVRAVAGQSPRVRARRRPDIAVPAEEDGAFDLRSILDSQDEADSIDQFCAWIFCKPEDKQAELIEQLSTRLEIPK